MKKKRNNDWRKLRLFVIKQFTPRLSRKEAEKFALEVVNIFKRNFRIARQLIRQQT